MKWIYILILFLMAAYTLGCVDKNQAETTTEASTGTPAQTLALPGESAASPSEVNQTPAPGEDIFKTYSDLAEIDNMSKDMDMQIALSNEI